jgi:hypothetical protein
MRSNFFAPILFIEPLGLSRWAFAAGEARVVK